MWKLLRYIVIELSKLAMETLKIGMRTFDIVMETLEAVKGAYEAKENSSNQQFGTTRTFCKKILLYSQELIVLGQIAAKLKMFRIKNCLTLKKKTISRTLMCNTFKFDK